MAQLLTALQQKGLSIDKVIEICQQQLGPAFYDKIPMDRRTDRQSFLRIQARAGIDRLVEVGKTDTHPVSEVEQPFQKEVSYRYFRRKFEVVREDMENDQYGFVTAGKIANDMARAERHLREIVAVEPLNNATVATGRFAGLDGVALVSQSHPTADGGTQSNSGLAGTQVDFSATNLQDAMTDMMQVDDYRGMPLVGLTDFCLIYPTAIHSSVMTVIGSDNIPSAGNNLGAFQRGTSDLAAANYNDVNWGGKMVTAIHNPYLTDPDGWFLYAKSEWEGFLEWMREAPRRFEIEDPHQIKYTLASEMKYGVVPMNWYGFWGTTGE